VAIFADTQDEPAYVYEQIKTLHDWAFWRSGPSIDVVSAGCLSADIMARHNGTRPRFAAIPAFTSGSEGKRGQLRRQCTREYKIAPIEKHVRKLLGLQKGQRAKGKVSATALIGISLDEVGRMRPSKTSWIENRYPLVEARLRRKDCLEVIKAAGLPEPKKSACVFCPYHDDAYWLWLQTEHPAEFERAAVMDEVFRNMSRSGDTRPVFLHRSLEALRSINFAERRRLPLFESDQFQNECEGHCGI
jgi:hypothetical protein